MLARTPSPKRRAAYKPQLSGIRRSKYRNVGNEGYFEFVEVFNHSLNNELPFARCNIPGVCWLDKSKPFQICHIFAA